MFRNFFFLLFICVVACASPLQKPILSQMEFDEVAGPADSAVGDEKTSFSFASGVDKETGLILAPGVEQVKANCVACHRATPILNAGGRTRNIWRSTVRSMYGNGLRPLEANIEEKILNYLEINYPPQCPACYRDNPISPCPLHPLPPSCKPCNNCASFSPH